MFLYLPLNVIAFDPILKIFYRIFAAFSTVPNFPAWLYAAVVLFIYTSITLLIGFQQGFLQFDVQTKRETVTNVMATCIFFPALSEELMFRVLLLPHPTESASMLELLIWGSIGLVSFIIYHPLNAMTFYPAGLKTFLNPVFLLLAAFLGVVCTLTYFQSGSLWIPVVIHWLVVVVWLLVLGGYSKLHEAETGE